MRNRRKVKDDSEVQLLCSNAKFEVNSGGRWFALFVGGLYFSVGIVGLYWLIREVPVVIRQGASPKVDLSTLLTGDFRSVSMSDFLPQVSFCFTAIIVALTTFNELKLRRPTEVELRRAWVTEVVSSARKENYILMSAGFSCLMCGLVVTAYGVYLMTVGVDDASAIVGIALLAVFIVTCILVSSFSRSANVKLSEYAYSFLRAAREEDLRRYCRLKYGECSENVSRGRIRRHLHLGDGSRFWGFTSVAVPLLLAVPNIINAWNHGYGWWRLAAVALSSASILIFYFSRRQILRSRVIYQSEDAGFGRIVTFIVALLWVIAMWVYMSCSSLINLMIVVNLASSDKGGDSSGWLPVIGPMLAAALVATVPLVEAGCAPRHYNVIYYRYFLEEKCSDFWRQVVVLEGKIVGLRVEKEDLQVVKKCVLDHLADGDLGRMRELRRLAEAGLQEHRKKKASSRASSKGKRQGVRASTASSVDGWHWGSRMGA